MSHFPPEMIEQSDRLCAAAPERIAIRDALLALEAQGEVAGWDRPVNSATLFVVERDTATDEIQVRAPRVVNGIFRIILDGNGGEPGPGLAELADVFAMANQALGPVGLHSGPSGAEFYGYAFRSEGWSTGPRADGSPEAAEATEYATRRELHNYPERIEIRQVWLAGQDGLSWWVLRVRGQEPQVLVTLPESDVASAGLVPNALVRMTNAYAGSHIPVPNLS